MQARRYQAGSLRPLQDLHKSHEALWTRLRSVFVCSHLTYTLPAADSGIFETYIEERLSTHCRQEPRKIRPRVALTRRKKFGPTNSVWLSASFVVLSLEEFLLRFSLSLSLFLLHGRIFHQSLLGTFFAG